MSTAGPYKCYNDLLGMDTFEERLEYLMLKGSVGKETFGFDRYLNQKFYASAEWKRFRRDMILRDNGCDLGVDDGWHDIHGRILLHHINPIIPKDFRENNLRVLMDPNNVICVSHRTHEAIHYGFKPDIYEIVERKPNDTIPWR